MKLLDREYEDVRGLTLFMATQAVVGHVALSAKDGGSCEAAISADITPSRYGCAPLAAPIHLCAEF